MRRDEPVAELGADDGRWWKDNHHNHKGYCTKKELTGYAQEIINL